MSGFYGGSAPEPSHYLEEAAVLLRKAATAYEASDRGYAALAEDQERIARQFAELAAIEMGVLPASLAKDLIDRIGGAA